MTVTANTPPEAHAGKDLTGDDAVDENDAVRLDGSASRDEDGDSLKYAWEQKLGTKVDLSGQTAAVNPSFTAPELLASENLVFSLTVHDGTEYSAPATVTVQVVADNDPPTANAGSDQTVKAGAPVTLSGSGSDPEGQELKYSWSQSSGTEVLDGGVATGERVEFSAPMSGGALVFSLTVNDGVNDSAADNVTVTVTAPQTPPETPGSFSVPVFANTVSYDIRWSASDGATSYVLEELSGEEWSNVEMNSPTVTLHDVFKTESGKYGYRVKACNAAGCSAWTRTRYVVYRSKPRFGDSSIPDQTWLSGKEIAELTVPAASGGDGELTYTDAGLPDGIAMSAALKISGTPKNAGSGTAKITVRDKDGDSGTLTFDWTVVDSARLTMGFDEHYTAHTGDLNGDQRTDIHLKHTPKLDFLPVNDTLVPVLPDHADVGDFVLRQNADGTFDIVAPTPAQQTLISQWPEADLYLTLGDFNLDNVADMSVSGISSIIPDALGQVVFASPQVGRAPTHAASMTQDMRDFFSDAYEWSRDHDYFEDNAPIRTDVKTVNTSMYLPEWCGTPGADLESRPPFDPFRAESLDDIHALAAAGILSCIADGLTQIHYDYVRVIYTIAVGEKDYTAFHQAALAFGDIMANVLADGGLFAQSSEAIELEQLLNSIWGLERFMGGVLSRGGVLQGEAGVPSEKRPQARAWMVDALVLHTDLINALVDAREAERERAKERMYTACYNRAWGPTPITKEVHYSRNLNQPNPWSHLSELPQDLFKNEGETPTHNIRTSGNDDWRGARGLMYEGWQLVYDASGHLVTDPVELGTYDYSSPYRSRAGHIELDVTPWVEWGNSTLDTSTRLERLTALYRTEYGIFSFAIGWYLKGIYECLYPPVTPGLSTAGE